MKNTESTIPATLPATSRNMLRVIELLRERQGCTTLDVAQLLNYKQSGARRYLRDLEMAGITVRSVRKITGQFDLVRLVDDEGRVQLFERQLKGGVPTEQQLNRAIMRRQVAEERQRGLLPGTMIHQTDDDDEVPVKRRRNVDVVVQRDPLVAALFGAPAVMHEARA